MPRFLIKYDLIFSLLSFRISPVRLCGLYQQNLEVVT